MADYLVQNFGKWANSDVLGDYIYALRDDGGPQAMKQRMTVMKCQMAPLFASVGLLLEGALGTGYRITYFPKQRRVDYQPQNELRV